MLLAWWCPWLAIQTVGSQGGRTAEAPGVFTGLPFLSLQAPTVVGITNTSLPKGQWEHCLRSAPRTPPPSATLHLPACFLAYYLLLPLNMNICGPPNICAHSIAFAGNAPTLYILHGKILPNFKPQLTPPSPQSFQQLPPSPGKIFSLELRSFPHATCIMVADVLFPEQQYTNLPGNKASC